MKSTSKEIPNSWIWTTIGEISTVIGGGTPKTDDETNYNKGEIPWLTPADLSGFNQKYVSHGGRFITGKGLQNSSARIMPAGTVLFSSRAPIGYVAIAKNPISTNQGFKSFVLKNGISSDYVFWYLKGIKELAESYASGTTFLELSGSKAKQLPIPIPPEKEQSRIVAEIEKQFSRLDEAVASLKRAKTNFKRYKAAVLKAAVEGKLTQQWRKEHPDVEPAEKLLQRILGERRVQWEQAGIARLGETPTTTSHATLKRKYKIPILPDHKFLNPLPKTWYWASTDQLFWFVTSGSRGWAKYYSDKGPLFLRVGNLDHDSISLDLRDIQRVQPPNGAEGSRTRVEPNDILISITADVGMIGIIPERFPEAYINQHISLARPVRVFHSSYLAWYLTSQLGQGQFKNLQRGATKTGLGLDDIRSIYIPLPPLDEQKEIVHQIEQRISVFEAISKTVDLSLGRAERFRQSILKEAFSGKLVPQDPNDEPAAVLLERIRLQKERRKAKGAGSEFP